MPKRTRTQKTKDRRGVAGVGIESVDISTTSARSRLSGKHVATCRSPHAHRHTSDGRAHGHASRRASRRAPGRLCRLRERCHGWRCCTGNFRLHLQHAKPLVPFAKAICVLCSCDGVGGAGFGSKAVARSCPNKHMHQKHSHATAAAAPGPAGVTERHVARGRSSSSHHRCTKRIPRAPCPFRPSAPVSR